MSYNNNNNNNFFWYLHTKKWNLQIFFSELVYSEQISASALPYRKYNFTEIIIIKIKISTSASYILTYSISNKRRHAHHLRYILEQNCKFINIKKKSNVPVMRILMFSIWQIYFCTTLLAGSRGNFNKLIKRIRIWSLYSKMQHL